MATRYQLYLEGIYATEWTTLADEYKLPDGRIVKTKILPDGRLQYARRNGVIGISAEPHVAGEPKPGQWRVHPADAAIRTSFHRAQPEKKKPPEIPEGVEFE